MSNIADTSQFWSLDFDTLLNAEPLLDARYNQNQVLEFLSRQSVASSKLGVARAPCDLLSTPSEEYYPSPDCGHFIDARKSDELPQYWINGGSDLSQPQASDSLAAQVCPLDGYLLSPDMSVSSQEASPMLTQSHHESRRSQHHGPESGKLEFVASVSGSRPSTYPTITMPPEPALQLDGNPGMDSVSPYSNTSPTVVIEMWEQENAAQPFHRDNVERLQPGGHSVMNFFPGSVSTVPVLPRPHDYDTQPASIIADDAGTRKGLSPDARTQEETLSPNEISTRRRVEESLRGWLREGNARIPPDQLPQASRPDDSNLEDDGIRSDEVPTGEETENKPLHNQIYYKESGGGAITQVDRDLLREHPFWNNVPIAFGITRSRHQPQSSQAAIDKWCHMNDSKVSITPTWGTRRRSLPSIDDIEGIVSGNFLSKLSLRQELRPSVLLKPFRGLARSSSASRNNLKRSLSPHIGRDTIDSSVPSNIEDYQKGFATPVRSPSWSKKSLPNFESAIISMGTSAGAIATAHARSKSVSKVQQAYSDSHNSLFGGLHVKGSRGRPRSKTAITVNTNLGSHSNLAAMWKKETGGPPVTPLAKTRDVGFDPNDEEEYDDDDLDDSYDLGDHISPIGGVQPTIDGFKQQILTLNPRLGQRSQWLVDRIARHQLLRYKSLQIHRIEHLKIIATGNCPCGPLCYKLGGSARLISPRKHSSATTPLISQAEGPLLDFVTPTSQAGAGVFPSNVPRPLTDSLPVEFECQLCFTRKTIQQPSHWTKHVHEDIQPFSCTWEDCKEHKTFKRKADWVRHENEGHRHIEWWTCDIDDCRRICYRRDNFRAHLIREHGFQEPQNKTKAAIKRADVLDPIWQQVDKCHEFTTVEPHEEPCRFCGKALPSWKKLISHLAKHMETLALPLWQLLDSDELSADTVISPIQDTATRSATPLMPVSTVSSGAGAITTIQTGDDMTVGLGLDQLDTDDAFELSNTRQLPPFLGAPLNPGEGMAGGLQENTPIPEFTFMAAQQEIPFQNLPSSHDALEYVLEDQQFGDVVQLDPQFGDTMQLDPQNEPFPEPFPAWDMEDYNTLGEFDSDGQEYYASSSVSPFSNARQ